MTGTWKTYKTTHSPSGKGRTSTKKNVQGDRQGLRPRPDADLRPLHEGGQGQGHRRREVDDARPLQQGRQAAVQELDLQGRSEEPHGGRHGARHQEPRQQGRRRLPRRPEGEGLMTIPTSTQTRRTGTPMSRRTIRAGLAGGIAAGSHPARRGGPRRPGPGQPGTADRRARPTASCTPAVGADAFAELTNNVVETYNSPGPAPTDLLESFDAVNPVTGHRGRANHHQAGLLGRPARTARTPASPRSSSTRRATSPPAATAPATASTGCGRAGRRERRPARPT